MSEKKLERNWYPLAIIVSIWGALYQASLRYRNEKPPQRAHDVIFSDKWEDDHSLTGGVLRGNRRRLDLLTERRCSNSLRAIDIAWSSVFDEPSPVLKRQTLEVICLYSPTSFAGTIWHDGYQELVCYVPEFRRVMSLKVSWRDAANLFQLLKVEVPSGRSPFASMRMTLSNCEVVPEFNRIRRTPGTRVSHATIGWLPSFQMLVDLCGGISTSPSSINAIVQGRYPLSFQESFVSRFLNALVLYRPFVTQCDVLSVYFSGWSYRVSINVGGQDLAGSFETPLCFDSNLDIEAIKGKNVSILGLLPLGLNTSGLRSTSFPILAVCPSSSITEYKDASLSSSNSPTIETVVNELRTAFSFRPPKFQQLPPLVGNLKQTEVERVEPEVGIEEQPSDTIPVDIPVDLTGLSPIQSELLVVLSERKWKMLPLGLIIRNTKRQRPRFSVHDIISGLEELEKKELVFQHVYQDRWQINPRVRLKFSPVNLEQVEHLILDVIRKVPRGVSQDVIIRNVLGTPGPKDRNDILQALRSLGSRKMVFRDRENLIRLYPPTKTIEKPKSSVPSSRLPENTLIYRDNDVQKIPEVMSAHLSRKVLVFKGNKLFRRMWVGSYKDSVALLQRLVNDVKNGDITSVSFFDQRGGRVTIKLVLGKLTCVYRNNDWRAIHAVKSFITPRSSNA